MAEQDFKKMCYCPISIKTEHGRMTVPCGRCAECLQKKRMEWTFRLLEQLKVSSSAGFWTWTYSDANLTGELSKRHIQSFIKKLRKEQALLSKETIKYFICGEYGEKTKRPHYHGIIFNLEETLKEKVEEIWEKGNIYYGDVTEASIHYTTKYVLKGQKERNTWALMSKGLGIAYVDEHKKNHWDTMSGFVVQDGGYKKNMPRYYARKIFSEKEREEIRLKKIQEMDIKLKREYDKNPEKAITKDQKLRKVKTRQSEKQSKSEKI